MSAFTRLALSSCALVGAMSIPAQTVKADKVCCLPLVVNNVMMNEAKAQYPINEPDIRKALETQFETWIVRIGKMNPMLAAGAMALSSVSDIFNSLRLRKAG